MKFAAFLREVQTHVPPEYYGQFLNYKQLKKQIKYTDPGDVDSCTNFLLALQDELDRVNRVFQSEAKRLARTRKRYLFFIPFTRYWSAWPFTRARREGRALKLLSTCFWCRQFAAINAAGLRKILKKYDKRLGRRDGAAFLQYCWQGDNMEQGSILHSPLLNDLLGLEALLKEREGVVMDKRIVRIVEPLSTQRHRHKVTGGQQKRTPGDGGAAAAFDVHDDNDGGEEGYATSEESEDDSGDVGLKCAICLNYFYHPIGLSCGHTFCERCLVTTAKLDHVIGPIVAVLKRAPEATFCPECRQTGVFGNALKLRELDELVKMRYPKEWREQASEDWSHKQRLLRLFLRQRFRKRVCTFDDELSSSNGRTSMLLERLSTLPPPGSANSYASLPEWVRQEDIATADVYQLHERHARRLDAHLPGHLPQQLPRDLPRDGSDGTRGGAPGHSVSRGGSACSSLRRDPHGTRPVGGNADGAVGTAQSLQSSTAGPDCGSSTRRRARLFEQHSPFHALVDNSGLTATCTAATATVDQALHSSAQLQAGNYSSSRLAEEHPCPLETQLMLTYQARSDVASETEHARQARGQQRDEGLHVELQRGVFVMGASCSRSRDSHALAEGSSKQWDSHGRAESFLNRCSHMFDGEMEATTAAGVTALHNREGGHEDPCQQFGEGDRCVRSRQAAHPAVLQDGHMPVAMQPYTTMMLHQLVVGAEIHHDANVRGTAQQPHRIEE